MPSRPAPAKRPRPKTPSKDRGTIDRRAVLDAASRLLVEEGPEALTMRRLATELGASTMVLYARFESRGVLLEGLLAEGFSRFADALSTVQVRDPEEHLRELGRAYRRFARENPAYYRLMWSPDAAHGLPPSSTPAHAVHGQRAFGALLVAVTRVLAAQDRSAREAEPLAVSIWSLVHGFCSLELAGAMPPGLADPSYESTLDFAVRGLHQP